MPQLISRADVEAFAHCVNPLCSGYAQEKVPAVREEMGSTYLESGGDLPFIEKSAVRLAFADEADISCKACGAGRDLTEQARVSYQNLSGHTPDGLLQFKE